MGEKHMRGRGELQSVAFISSMLECVLGGLDRRRRLVLLLYVVLCYSRSAPLVFFIALSPPASS